MLRIVVIGTTAEERNSLHKRVSAFVSVELDELKYFPQISIKPMTPEEIKFHDVPDLCVIEAEFAMRHSAHLTALVQSHPNTPIMAILGRDHDSLGVFDQLSRLGVAEVLREDESGSDFLRKLIFLTRNGSVRAPSGKLVSVSAGKGGIGVTTLVAGLAEAAADRGLTVGVVDLDFETQDLSRFLHAKPYLNESLQLLLDGLRPLSEDSVTECFQPVWDDFPRLFCMSPPLNAHLLNSGELGSLRLLKSLLNAAANRFDLLLIDCAALQRGLAEHIHRWANGVLAVVSNDPAAMFASVSHLQWLKGVLPDTSALQIVENRLYQKGLPSRLVSSEIRAVAALDKDAWVRAPVRFSQAVFQWPGSGATPYSIGGKSTRTVFQSVLNELALMPDLSAALDAKATALLGTRERLREVLRCRWLATPSKDTPQVKTDPGKLLLPAASLPEVVEAGEPVSFISEPSFGYARTDLENENGRKR